MKRHSLYTTSFDKVFIVFLGFFVLFFLFVLGSIFVSCSGIGSETVQRNAESDARDFVANEISWITNPRIHCQSTDSDMDGYVTCTVSGASHDRMELYSIMCRTSLFANFQRGCKLVPMVAPIRNTE